MGFIWLGISVLFPHWIAELGFRQGKIPMSAESEAVIGRSLIGLPRSKRPKFQLVSGDFSKVFVASGLWPSSSKVWLTSQWLSSPSALAPPAFRTRVRNLRSFLVVLRTTLVLWIAALSLFVPGPVLRALLYERPIGRVLGAREILSAWLIYPWMRILVSAYLAVSEELGWENTKVKTPLPSHQYLKRFSSVMTALLAAPQFSG